jgi:hypothetical protein
MPPDAESLERWTHRSDWTIAAHGCNSVVDDVIRNAVTNPATGPGGRLETVALEIRVPLRDDNPPRSGVNHVVVQAHNEVTNRRSAAHVLPCVGGSPGDIGGIELGKVTTTVRRRPHERSARSPSRLDQLREDAFVDLGALAPVDHESASQRQPRLVDATHGWSLAGPHRSRVHVPQADGIMSAIGVRVGSVRFSVVDSRIPAD